MGLPVAWHVWSEHESSMLCMRALGSARTTRIQRALVRYNRHVVFSKCLMSLVFVLLNAYVGTSAVSDMSYCIKGQKEDGPEERPKKRQRVKANAISAESAVVANKSLSIDYSAAGPLYSQECFQPSLCFHIVFIWFMHCPI